MNHYVTYTNTDPITGREFTHTRRCDTLAKVYRTLRSKSIGPYVEVTLDLDVEGCAIQQPTIELSGTPQEVTESIKRPFRGL